MLGRIRMRHNIGEVVAQWPDEPERDDLEWTRGGLG